MSKCECVRCADCGGTGNIWFDLAGRYLGNHRCDDLDEMEPCEECGGSGIAETCYACMDARDAEYDAEDARL